MITRDLIVLEARSYIGVPFVHQGRSLLGLDCAGLIVRVARNLGISDADYSAYGRSPDSGKLRQQMDGHCNYLPPGTKPKPGMIALMRFESEPQHLAIVGERAGMPTIIHALASARKVVEHRLGSQWQARIVALYDFPGVV